MARRRSETQAHPIPGTGLFKAHPAPASANAADRAIPRTPADDESLSGLETAAAKLMAALMDDPDHPCAPAMRARLADLDAAICYGRAMKARR